jgi:hypothetical protein
MRKAKDKKLFQTICPGFVKSSAELLEIMANRGMFQVPVPSQSPALTMEMIEKDCLKWETSGFGKSGFSLRNRLDSQKSILQNRMSPCLSDLSAGAKGSAAAYMLSLFQVAR